MKKLDLNIQLFAATLATQTLTELSYDVATNTSQVRYLVQIQTTGQSHNDNNITTTYYIDGIQYTNVHKLPYNSLTTIVDKTVTINHNLDGTREVTASFSCPTQISAGTITGTKTTVLTTIPRASEITCSSGNIEDVLSVKIASNSNTFTHTITYTIGTYSGTLATKTSQTTIDFNTASIKDYIYSQIPNGTSISGTIRCTTYSGNTQIGDVKTSSFTLSVSRERCCPTITNVSCIDTNTNLQQFTGSNQKFIRYKSLPKVDFTATARNSSSIASLYISMNGGQAFTSKPCTFTNMVSNIITITATDTRGFSSQFQLTLDMIPYVELSIAGDVKRDEELSFEGFFTGSIGIYNGSLGVVNNTLAISYDYRLSSASSFTTGGTISTYTLSGNKAILNHVSLGSNYNPDNEYIVRIYVTDKLGMHYGDIVFQKGTAVVEIGDEYVNVNGILTNNNLSVTDITNRIKGDSIYNGNANDYKVPSFHYMASNGNSNVPANWTELLTLGNGGNDIAQFGISIEDENAYTRVCNSGTWKNWKRLAFANEMPTKLSQLTNDSGFISSIPPSYLKETVLYNNATGSNGDISLNDSVANYKYIEIYYMDNNGQDGGYVKLYNINGKKFDINLIEAGSSSTFIRRTGYTANGNVLTIRQSGYVQVGSSNHTETGTNYLYITRVVGLN